MLIDAEHAFNKEFARKIGVNIEVSVERYDWTLDLASPVDCRDYPQAGHMQM